MEDRADIAGTKLGPEDLHRYSCVSRQLSKHTTTLAARTLNRVNDSVLRQGNASEQIDCDQAHGHGESKIMRAGNKPTLRLIIRHVSSPALGYHTQSTNSESLAFATRGN
jgi:hypothetical protein